MAYNTIEIAVKGSFEVEGIATETILPGQICTVTSDVTGNYYKLNLDNLNRVPPLFSVVDIYTGKTITDPYLLDDRMFLRWGRKGDLFYGLQAGGQSVNKGQSMKNQNGFLRQTANLAEAVVISMDTVTSPAGVPTFLRAVVI